MLLDTVVFVTNLGFMGLLTGYFTEVIRRASEDDPGAQLVLMACAAAMFVLPPAGAVLKRWHFHERQKATKELPERPQLKKNPLAWLMSPVRPKFDGAGGCTHFGCFFSGLFHFVLAIFLAAVVMSLLQTMFFRERGENATIFVPLVILSLALCVVQTVLVYRYFLRPESPPKSDFLRDPKSEILGDLCIFINMFFFQVFWNVVLREFPSIKVDSFSDFAGNLFFFSFIALLIYVPPRVFYLVEDYRRPISWITMFIANLPAIIRVLLGANEN